MEDMGTTNVNRLGSFVALVTSRGFQWIPGCQRVTVSVQFFHCWLSPLIPQRGGKSWPNIPILCGFPTRNKCVVFRCHAKTSKSRNIISGLISHWLDSFSGEMIILLFSRFKKIRWRFFSYWDDQWHLVRLSHFLFVTAPSRTESSEFE